MRAHGSRGPLWARGGRALTARFWTVDSTLAMEDRILVFSGYFENFTVVDGLAASHHPTREERWCDISGPTVFVAPCGFTNMYPGRWRPVPRMQSVPLRLPAYPQGLSFPHQLNPPPPSSAASRPSSFPVQFRASQEKPRFLPLWSWLGRHIRIGYVHGVNALWRRTFGHCCLHMHTCIRSCAS